MNHGISIPIKSIRMSSNDEILRKKLYTKHLCNIDGIKFTMREIDVMASLMYENKTLKGTAKFLSTGTKSISARSIETYIFNIRRKIGAANKDSVIDFIKNSGKSNYLNLYYIAITLEKEFTSTLKQISFVLKDESLTFLIILPELPSNDEASYTDIQFTVSALENHLRLLGKVEKCSYLPYSTYMRSGQKYKNAICVLDGPAYDKAWENVFSGLQGNIICLTLSSIQISKVVPNVSYIDASQIKNYYNLFFTILLKCYDTPAIQDIIVRFCNIMDNAVKLPLTNAFNNDISEAPPPLTETAQIKRSLLANILNNFILKTKSNIWKFLIVSILLILGAAITINWSDLSERTKQKIATINKITQEVTAQCSTNNITKHTRENNYQFIKQIEQVYENLQDTKIYDYFAKSTISSLELTRLLYSLCVLSNHYNINDHNGLKAREVLYKAKSLAEHYIQNRSAIKVDLNTLTPEQTYMEIKDLPDLREMYTIIIYLIGRTYTYQGDRLESLKYFEMAKYLGLKFGLFEGYLSSIGIAKTHKTLILKYISDNEYKKAQKEINDAILVYKGLKTDTTVYKDSYRPGSTQNKYNKMIPIENTYNLVECEEEISRYYCLLIYTTLLNSNKLSYDEISSYVHEIEKQYIGNDSTPGIFSQLDKLQPKKIASVCNTLANILLLLYDYKIDCKNLSQSARKYLKLQQDNQDLISLSNNDIQLDLIKQIFAYAESLSRQGDYTCADANSGLMAVYQRVLANTPHLTNKQRDLVIQKIEYHQTKRNNINQTLNRTCATDDVLCVMCR